MSDYEEQAARQAAYRAKLVKAMTGENALSDLIGSYQGRQPEGMAMPMPDYHNGSKEPGFNPWDYSQTMPHSPSGNKLDRNQLLQLLRSMGTI